MSARKKPPKKKLPKLRINEMRTGARHVGQEESQLFAGSLTLSFNVPIHPNDRPILSDFGFDVEEENPIGSGITATVYKGKCNERAERIGADGRIESLSGRLCAIKACLATSEKPGSSSEEARLLTELRHPSIVEVYLNLKSGPHATPPVSSPSFFPSFLPSTSTTTSCAYRYYIMEYMDGGTLTQRLSVVHSRIPESEVITIFRQLMAGLQYLHNKGIIHNDLHAWNIMMTSDKSRYKLVDFGSARQLKDELSPEQMVRRDINMLGGHFIRVLERSEDFVNQQLKVNLRDLCDWMQNIGPEANMNQVVDRFNEILPPEETFEEESKHEESEGEDEDQVFILTGNQKISGVFFKRGQRKY